MVICDVIQEPMLDKELTSSNELEPNKIQDSIMRAATLLCVYTFGLLYMSTRSSVHTHLVLCIYTLGPVYTCLVIRTCILTGLLNCPTIFCQRCVVCRTGKGRLFPYHFGQVYFGLSGKQPESQQEVFLPECSPIGVLCLGRKVASCFEDVCSQ